MNESPAIPTIYRAAWHLVRQIPPGRVMTYGQIATLLGTPRAARAVGYAMF
ncbi:MAG: MGMT family protein, partial [Deltaproteobacteria bacterium]|nr:MGMT family protein [Deltaproteobacteria bacterium]